MYSMNVCLVEIDLIGTLSSLIYRWMDHVADAS